MEEFRQRNLPFDDEAARDRSGRHAVSRPISQFDAAMAAIARSKGAALATRNTADFENCGIQLIDPGANEPDLWVAPSPDCAVSWI